MVSLASAIIVFFPLLSLLVSFIFLLSDGKKRKKILKSEYTNMRYEYRTSHFSFPHDATYRSTIGIAYPSDLFTMQAQALMIMLFACVKFILSSMCMSTISHVPLPHITSRLNKYTYII